MTCQSAVKAKEKCTTSEHLHKTAHKIGIRELLYKASPKLNNSKKQTAFHNILAVAANLCTTCILLLLQYSSCLLWSAVYMEDARHVQSKPP